MRHDGPQALFQAYVDGWVHGDPAEILAVLDPDCVIVESHGPTYRGTKSVARWIAEWFGAGGVVEAWDVTSFYHQGTAAFVEWDFTCVFAGNRTRFAGASVLQCSGGRIRELHEYRMTEAPFDWTAQEAGGGAAAG